MRKDIHLQDRQDVLCHRSWSVRRERHHSTRARGTFFHISVLVVLTHSIGTFRPGRQRLLTSVPRSVHQHPNGRKREAGAYTSTTYPDTLSSVSSKEAFYGKELILADRDMVETESDEIMRDADKEDVALLVVGDPFGCVSPPSRPLRTAPPNQPPHPSLTAQPRTPTSSSARAPPTSRCRSSTTPPS